MTELNAPARMRIEVRGSVQGVGFRPFAYRLADELRLSGWIVNDNRGVAIEVEGERARVEEFALRLAREKPAIATIAAMTTAWCPPTGIPGFEIRKSQETGAKTVPILPDLATCPACLCEVLDPADRRHRYPFANCTHCGPRFSIVRALPYDRPNTTMARFAMCPACRREYEDPRDRRFHAQPIACAVCGPSLSYLDASGKETARRDEALAEAVARLTRGEVIAVKGIGGFHLMVDARSGEAVAKLRTRKPRREKPLAVMAADLRQARELCVLNAQEEAALASPEAPILLARRGDRCAVHPTVAPSNPYLGVMLAYTPLHHLLLRGCGFPLVATSGNLAEEPICTSEDEAVRRLAGIADGYLIHDRPIARHVDDSIVWFLDGDVRVLRRARGFAPRPVSCGHELPSILAVGAHLKNAVALSAGRDVFVSQHIGDMEAVESTLAFERVIDDFLRLYEARPVAIAHDLHPDYFTTRWARGQGLPLIGVQHHHAHLASCLADNDVAGPALGVTWDGTGLGLDGSVWGGEFLKGEASSSERVAHLRTFRLPGGDAAVREPRRSAVSLLWELFGDGAFEREDLEPVRSLSSADRRVLAVMLDRGVSAPVTSSAGRLFDGVASLTGLTQVSAFEGQAAMALEFVADESVRDAYPLPVTRGATDDAALVVDWRPLVLAVLDDVARKTPAPSISARFHQALAEAIAAVAREIGLEHVALSGGCFQNRLLTARTVAALRSAGHHVLLHRRVPPGDGGIALGQIAAAAARLKTEL